MTTTTIHAPAILGVRNATNTTTAKHGDGTRADEYSPLPSFALANDAAPSLSRYRANSGDDCAKFNPLAKGAA